MTPNLASLSHVNDYWGHDKLHVGDSNGLQVSHIVHGIINVATYTFSVNNVLYVPQISKLLLSYIQ